MWLYGRPDGGRTLGDLPLMLLIRAAVCGRLAHVGDARKACAGGKRDRAQAARTCAHVFAVRRAESRARGVVGVREAIPG